jgi:hypothetical protein
VTYIEKKFDVEPKKVKFTGSEIIMGVMRAQQRDIQKNRVAY